MPFAVEHEAQRLRRLSFFLLARIIPADRPAPWRQKLTIISQWPPPPAFRHQEPNCGAARPRKPAARTGPTKTRHRYRMPPLPACAGPLECIPLINRLIRLKLPDPADSATAPVDQKRHPSPSAYPASRSLRSMETLHRSLNATNTDASSDDSPDNTIDMIYIYP